MWDAVIAGGAGDRRRWQTGGDWVSGTQRARAHSVMRKVSVRYCDVESGCDCDCDCRREFWYESLVRDTGEKMSIKHKMKLTIKSPSTFRLSGRPVTLDRCLWSTYVVVQNNYYWLSF
jgi:hypothetical protein